MALCACLSMCMFLCSNSVLLCVRWEDNSEQSLISLSSKTIFYSHFHIHDTLTFSVSGPWQHYPPLGGLLLCVAAFGTLTQRQINRQTRTWINIFRQWSEARFGILKPELHFSSCVGCKLWHSVASLEAVEEDMLKLYPWLWQPPAEEILRSTSRSHCGYQLNLSLSLSCLSCCLVVLSNKTKVAKQCSQPLPYMSPPLPLNHPPMSLSAIDPPLKQKLKINTIRWQLKPANHKSLRMWKWRKKTWPVFTNEHWAGLLRWSE